jgi:hypothetical protein
LQSNPEGSTSEPTEKPTVTDSNPLPTTPSEESQRDVSEHVTSSGTTTPLPGDEIDVTLLESIYRKASSGPTEVRASDDDKLLQSPFGRFTGGLGAPDEKVSYVMPMNLEEWVNNPILIAFVTAGIFESARFVRSSSEVELPHFVKTSTKKGVASAASSWDTYLGGVQNAFKEPTSDRSYTGIYQSGRLWVLKRIASHNGKGNMLIPEHDPLVKILNGSLPNWISKNRSAALRFERTLAQAALNGGKRVNVNPQSMIIPWGKYQSKLVPQDHKWSVGTIFTVEERKWFNQQFKTALDLWRRFHSKETYSALSNFDEADKFVDDDSTIRFNNSKKHLNELSDRLFANRKSSAFTKQKVSKSKLTTLESRVINGDIDLNDFIKHWGPWGVIDGGLHTTTKNFNTTTFIYDEICGVGRLREDVICYSHGFSKEEAKRLSPGPILTEYIKFVSMAVENLDRNLSETLFQRNPSSKQQWVSIRACAGYQKATELCDNQGLPYIPNTHPEFKHKISFEQFVTNEDYQSYYENHPNKNTLPGGMQTFASANKWSAPADAVVKPPKSKFSK